MKVLRPSGIVLLGMMTKMPVAGVIWQTLHYLIGLRRMGYEVTYVEAHARTPSMFTRHQGEDGSPRAAAFLDALLRRFGFEDRWALHALHGDGRCYGMSLERLHRAYDSAALLINLHGGTTPLPEHCATGRLVYLETDPVQLQIELCHGNPQTEAFLEPHCAFFTFGENYGRPGCGLPVDARFDFKPTRQPVVMDLWADGDAADRGVITTIGNWSTPWRDLRYEADTYYWSKDREFRKVLGLPGRVKSPLELTLSNLPDEDRRLLESNGWRVRDATTLSDDIDAYRHYIVASRGEFTVAKDQNIRFRSGWFSDRSATYLAAGRPVVTQDTGFGDVIPTGAGLFAYRTEADAADALARIDAEYHHHSRAALGLAREYFDHRVVLEHLLGEVGVPPARSIRPARGAFPDELVIAPVSRHPTRLDGATERAVLRRPVAPAPRDVTGRPIAAEDEVGGANPAATVIVPTLNKLAFTRLCLESLLAHPADAEFEVIVVDNGSDDDTPGYLTRLADMDPRVRLILNEENRGFAGANNQALEVARGRILVLLNNDTIVPPGWLGRLIRHLREPAVGAVGPVTNRICNEAQVPADYRTYGGFMELARGRARHYDGRSFEIPRLTMFCFAMTRTVFDQVGLLDESYGVGTLEDDDYSLRLRRAGLRTLCAEDVFVHHFDKASFGELVPDGGYDRLLRSNRRRFERKWGVAWEPYGRRVDPEYEKLRESIRALVFDHVPSRATVLVASRGDDALLELDDERRGWHFPQTDDGVYAGHYPADDNEAISQLESLRSRGAEYLVFPRTGLWWLDHYRKLRSHLDARYGAVASRPEIGVLYDLKGRSP